MKIALKIALLTLLSTVFYTYVGQLVPQKEVHPPEVTELAADMSTEDLVEVGRQVFEGKGMCNTCHTIGQSGALRFPDLAGVAGRAATRVAGLGSLEYMAQSLYDPEAFIVPGFAGGMPQVDRPPIDLTDQEIRAVLSYLETLGGEATITMQTPIPFAEGGGIAVAAAGEQAAAEAEAGVAAGAATAVPAGAGGAGALASRYQCASCHGGAGAGPPLPAIAARLDRRAIVGALATHQQLAAGPELAAAGYGEATLAELETLAGWVESGGAPR